MRIFVGARLFDGFGWRDDCALVTRAARSRRSSLTPSGRRARPSISAAACWRRASSIGRSTAAAALLFNDAPTPETIRGIVAAHRRFGTTALAPTVITDAPEVLASALDGRAARRRRLARRACRGAVHRPQAQRRASARAYPPMTRRPTRGADRGARLRGHGRAGFRLAGADRAGSAASGVVVSLGHSDASAEEARACFDAGVRCVTHLFNAMSPLTSRAPGVVGAALDDARIFAGFIADGLHVRRPGRAARLSAERRLAVDADLRRHAAGGGRADVYELGGRKVERRGRA